MARNPQKLVRKCADGKVRAFPRWLGNPFAVARLCALRELGLSYRDIAALEGCTEFTAYYAVNPDAYHK